MYCNKCGKEVDASSAFCPNCGVVLNEKVGLGNSLGGAAVGIGVAFLLIGIIGGLIAVSFVVSRGSNFGYSSWNYQYGGGLEVGIGISVAAGASFIIGLCVLIGASASK